MSINLAMVIVICTITVCIAATAIVDILNTNKNDRVAEDE